MQAQRREEAVDGVDLINRMLQRRPAGTAYPKWDEIAGSPMLGQFRTAPGGWGDLARRMEWGTAEPLPGWRIHYVAAQDTYAFSLTDTRDPCRFTFASNDTGTVIEGQPTRMRGVRVVPLDSSQ
jgi:hypothetical protein